MTPDDRRFDQLKGIAEAKKKQAALAQVKLNTAGQQLDGLARAADDAHAKMESAVLAWKEACERVRKSLKRYAGLRAEAIQAEYASELAAASLASNVKDN